MKEFIGQKCKFYLRKDSTSEVGGGEYTISVTSTLREVKNGLFITETYLIPVASVSYVETVA